MICQMDTHSTHTDIENQMCTCTHLHTHTHTHTHAYTYTYTYTPTHTPTHIHRYRGNRNVIVAHSYGTSLSSRIYPSIKQWVDAYGTYVCARAFIRVVHVYPHVRLHVYARACPCPRAPVFLLLDNGENVNQYVSTYTRLHLLSCLETWTQQQGI